MKEIIVNSEVMDNDFTLNEIPSGAKEKNLLTDLSTALNIIKEFEEEKYYTNAI